MINVLYVQRKARVRITRLLSYISSNSHLTSLLHHLAFTILPFSVNFGFFATHKQYGLGNHADGMVDAELCIRDAMASTISSP